MENTVKKLIDTANTWAGYLEKKSNSQLDSKTDNAGSNNYTCFARDYKIHTGQNLQAQPWCAMFVSEMFVQAFGLEAAVQLLGGALYHYCPTGVNQFKKKGKWSQKAESGSVIFFTNGTHAYHTGIVTEVTATRVKTIEGNTSGASGVIENGGGVCWKSYSLTDGKIMGYGLPDWSAIAQVQEEKHEGWIEAAKGWWYQYKDGSYAHSGWYWLTEKATGTSAWYLFDAAGYMLTGYQTAPDGRKYFLCPDKGVDEGKCMVTDDQGALHIAEYDVKNKRYAI